MKDFIFIVVNKFLSLVFREHDIVIGVIHFKNAEPPRVRFNVLNVDHLLAAPFSICVMALDGLNERNQRIGKEAFLETLNNYYDKLGSEKIKLENDPKEQRGHCLFCGGEDLTERELISEDEPKRPYAFAVFCRDCHAQGPSHAPIGWLESKKAAWEAFSNPKENRGET